MTAGSIAATLSAAHQRRTQIRSAGDLQDAAQAYATQDLVWQQIRPGARVRAWKVGGANDRVEPTASPVLRLEQSPFHPLDRQGVFGPHIDEALAGADGVGADDHAFDNAMGVSLQDAPVHVGAGVSLIGVADDILGHPGRLAAAGPFPPCGEASATPPPEP